MDRQQEHKPVTVLATTQPTGETSGPNARRARWYWVEPTVWTDRMLTALETGFEGNVWFRLIDKVFSPKNLLSSFEKVAKNKGAAGVDNMSIEMFEKNMLTFLPKLSEDLRTDKYVPKPIKRVYIPKPGSDQKRPLGIPTVRDRVVQTALRNVIEPIFEATFAQHSYGFRPGKGCKDALRRVDELLKKGYRYVVDADLKSYFDTIPHDKLMELVRLRIADGRVLKLIQSFLNQNIMEEMKLWKPTTGSPQGAVISPLLSNIYLNPLDHLMATRGIEMVRYADDFVILCQSKADADAALDLVKQWTTEVDLTLHPEKTKIADAVEEGFEFLGYRFIKGRRWPRSKSNQKLKDTLRQRTRRCNGTSLNQILAHVNPVLRGWFNYFKHCERFTFERLDQWVRMRLRSILRRRRHRKGRGRGKDHQRWPNAFFKRQGLYSTLEAHVKACQPAVR